MRLIVALIVLTPLLSVANASIGQCTGPEPALGIVQITGGSADSTFYVDDRNYLLGNGIWTYAETNGIWTQKAPGVVHGDPHHEDLQRGLNAYFALVPDWAEDICTDDPNVIPDSVIL